MTTTTLDAEMITNAVMVARRAPFLYNCQPWRWVTDGKVIELFADHGCISDATDSPRAGKSSSVAAAQWTTFGWRWPRAVGTP